MAKRYAIVDTLTAIMTDCNSLPADEVRYLQDIHNINLHASADECDDYLDIDPSNEIEDAMSEIDEDEFIVTLTMEPLNNIRSCRG